MSEHTSPPTLPILSAAMRASQFLMLDSMLEMPYIKGAANRIVATAIELANLDAIDASVSVGRHFGTRESLPPNELRIPVSINSIAEMTGMPFESVRRRVQKMLADGVCELTRKGVRIPVRVAGEQSIADMCTQLYGLVRTFYRQLKDTGALPPALTQPVAPAAGPALERMVARLARRHCIRLVAAFGRTHGDLTISIIVLAVICHNTRHVANTVATAVSAGLMEDDDKVPVTASAIAAKLGLAEATVATRIASLVRKGIFLRRKRGVIYTQSLTQSDHMLRLLEYNYSSLTELLAPLHRHGVLARWDAESLVDGNPNVSRLAANVGTMTSSDVGGKSAY